MHNESRIFSPCSRQEERMNSSPEDHNDGMPHERNYEDISFRLQNAFVEYLDGFSSQCLDHHQQTGVLLSNNDPESSLDAAAPSITCSAERVNSEKAITHDTRQLPQQGQEIDLSTEERHLIHDLQDTCGNGKSKPPEDTSGHDGAVQRTHTPAEQDTSPMEASLVLLPPAPTTLNLMADPNTVFGRSTANHRYDKFQPAPGTLRIWRETCRVTTRLDQRQKHYLYSFAPDHNVDLALMGNVNVSVVELITFFPNHHMWRHYMMRFYESGWTGGRMMEVMRYVRNWPFKDDSTRTHITKHVNLKPGTRKPLRDRTPYIDLSCGAWSTRRHNKFSKQLLLGCHIEDLACGVRRGRFAQGTDKGALTRTIEYVLDNPQMLVCRLLKLSHLESFVEIIGFEPMAVNVVGEHPDVVALRP